MNKQEKNKFSGKECMFCREAKLNIKDITEYGSAIICKVGSGKEGWFATLSPKTGGEPEKDFTIQIIPNDHIKNFGEINKNLELARNYGLIFAKISNVIACIIKGEEDNKIPIGTYGKCKHEDEHVHIKIFPYRGEIGQPFTVDSSFEKKEVFRDNNQEQFVKMKPIVKKEISKKRFEELKKLLIDKLR